MSEPRAAQRSMLQQTTQADTKPVEVSTPAELADAVVDGALDIVIINHLDLTTLELKYDSSPQISLTADTF